MTGYVIKDGNGYDVTGFFTGIKLETGKLIVEKAKLTVETPSAHKPYDGTPLTAEGTMSGLVNDETATFVTTGSQTDVGTSVNSYRVTFDGTAAEGNYQIVEKLIGNLTVSEANIEDEESFDVSTPEDVVYNGAEQKQPITITTRGADPKTLIKDKDYEVTYSDDCVNVGTVTVTITGKGNYTGTVRRTYKITPKAVTVTAEDKSKAYGEADPELTAKVEGTVGTDTVEYEISRAEGEDAGTYAITPAGEKAQGNYTVTYEPGTLTITPAKGNEITPEPGDDSETMDADGKSITVVYDGKPHTVSATASKEGSEIEYSTDGGKTWSKTAPSLTNVGEVEFSIRATNPNYETVVKDGFKLTVTPKEVTVTANDVTKTAGGADPAFTATVTGLIGSDTVTYTITRAEGEDAGTYAITPSGEAAQGNYTVKFVSGTLTINAAPAPAPTPTPTPAPTPEPAGDDGDDTPAPIVIPEPAAADPAPAPAPAVVPAPAQPVPAPQPAAEPEPEPTPEVIAPEPSAEPAPSAAPAEPVEIDEPDVPMAQPKYWALINLLSAVLASLVGLGMVVTFFTKKKEDEEEEDKEKAKERNSSEEEEEDPNKRRPSKFLGLIPAIASVILFILTENMNNPMRLTDKWTIWMVVLALINIALAYLTRNQKMGRLVFDANGGTGTMSSIIGEMGKDVTITSNAFTNDGYTFAGWNTEADGSGESYGDGDSWKMSEDKPNRLFAQWKH